MLKNWEFLLEDPPSNAGTSETVTDGATASEGVPSSLLSNATDGQGNPAGQGGEAAPLEGAEGAGADSGSSANANAFDPAQLVLPEGATLVEEDAAALSALLNDDKLTGQERGQKLVDLYTSQIEKLTKAGQEAAVASWNEMNEQWRNEVRALPEFASDLEGTLGATKQALVSLGAKPEFFAALDLTGAGNNPHILQMLHTLTKPYIEGKAVGGGQATANSQAAKLAAMYPSMQPKG